MTLENLTMNYKAVGKPSGTPLICSKSVLMQDTANVRISVDRV